MIPPQLSRRHVIGTATATLLASCATGKAQPHEVDIARLLDDAAESYGTIGYSFALLRGRRLIYERHRGVSSLQDNEPVSRRTLYPIYSVTKIFVALELARFAERGRVDLDAPLSALREGLPPAWRTISLRQALGHASGLPDYLHFPADPPADEEAAFASILDAPMSFEPGTHNQYNQTNLLFARLALERASGQSLETLLARHFAEGGMRETRYASPSASSPHAALSYRPQPDRRGAPALSPPAIWPAYTRASTGLVANLADMIAWSEALVGGRFLSRQSLSARYWVPFALQSGAPGAYSNGWQYAERDGLIFVGHEGGDRVIWRHVFERDNPANSVTAIYLDNGGRTYLKPARLADIAAESVLAGVASPTARWEEALFQLLARGNETAAIARLSEAARSADTARLEANLNRLGYEALYALGPNAAITIFRFNTERFTQSANTHDSLGEALRAVGDLVGARAAYARALALDPQNPRIESVIAELDRELDRRP